MLLASTTHDTIQIWDADNFIMIESFIAHRPVQDAYLTDDNRILVLPQGAPEIDVYEWSSPKVDLSLTANYCDTLIDDVLLAEAMVFTGTTAYEWSIGDSTQQIALDSTGHYAVTVTDDMGCSVTGTTAYVDSLDIITYTANQQPEVCNALNGSVSLNIQGGKVPYEVMWSTGNSGMSLSRLSAGTYGFTITDAAGCVGTDSILVTDTTYYFEVIPYVEQPTCGLKSGSIDWTPVGGVGQIEAVWSDGYVGLHRDSLASGGHRIQLTDSLGCVANGTVALGCVDSIELRVVQPIYFPQDYLLADSTYDFQVTLINQGTVSYEDSIYFLNGVDLEYSRSVGYFSIAPNNAVVISDTYTPRSDYGRTTVPVAVGFQLDSTIRVVDFSDHSNPVYVDVCENVDLDGDGFIACLDCDDQDYREFPGQVWYSDFDGDGYGSGDSLVSCVRPFGYHSLDSLYTITGDCDDGNPFSYPGNQHTVTTLVDYGPGSLHAVIACAEAGDTIDFASDLHLDTIRLLQYDLQIDKDLTISSEYDITIDGSRLDYNLIVDSMRWVQIYGLDLLAGRRQGGALHSEGITTLGNMIIYQRDSVPIINLQTISIKDTVRVVE